MDAVTRRQLDMGARALEFSREHPDASPGSALALTGLQDQLKAADALAAEQQDGTRAVRAATARKFELREEMNRSHLLHVARAGKAAAREIPELEQTFQFRRERAPYAEFRTRAQTMAAAADANKEILVRFGLADTSFDALKKSLADFDAATEQWMAGRLTHVAASAKLGAVAAEVVKIVKVMDGLNVYRFRDQPDLLAAWKSASKVRDFTRTPVEGEVKAA
jgi:hypothetical protein